MEDVKLVAVLPHLAYSYVLSHRLTTADLRMYRILKDLRNIKNMVILKPDKRDRVVVLNRTGYDNGTLKIIKYNEDLTLLREGSLQRFLRKLRTNGLLNSNVYQNIYPSGSQPARIYGLPKMHQARGPNSMPSFSPIYSFFNWDIQL